MGRTADVFIGYELTPGKALEFALWRLHEQLQIADQALVALDADDDRTQRSGLEVVAEIPDPGSG